MKEILAKRHRKFFLMTNFPHEKLQLASVHKIWDHSQHNAMTDLFFFRNRWFCAFRESDRHVHGDNGSIRLICSDDGNHWHSIKLFQEKGVDLRDPKLSLTPDGFLMLLVGGTLYNKEHTYISRQSRVAFSQDGKDWSPFTLILEPHEWLWRITWHNGKAYGASYRSSDPRNVKKEWLIKLFESSDGINYNLITPWNIPGYPSEATVRFFSSGEMIALVRREKKGNNKAWLGVSAPPYIIWDWKPTSHYFGGPNFLVLNDQTMWAAGRLCLTNPYGLFEKTVVASMSLEELNPLLILPSGGDTSYPGMVYHEGQLWITYYSSHEANTAIYLARVKIKS